ncbi:hypothetical protein ASY01nite_24390 [Acetobacter syzygii]|uniref:TraY domain-containing protein n=1 Tax=Acetobacter syzygii TaxID=146476 RepID=UPI0005DCD003|nr:TraY domain-containing protein [Acetobacter syzygii]GAN72164.1 hypothetical protein Absy_034_003 [Acetobacter syzygii]GBR64866.1 hypothetical protein AA0483_1573 [Acetobacter syzygii NRIC 0483]GEL57373.1 hypothetical protein ASY01nite_24390 [Acetobacter syzygii]
MSQEEVQIHIRVPADIKKKLETSAKETARSLNAEAAQRLADSFNPTTMAGRLDAAERGLAELLAKAILAREKQDRRSLEKMSEEEITWIGLWRDMNESQRRMALAMIQAAINSAA